jgi:hypothetical protein
MKTATLAQVLLRIATLAALVYLAGIFGGRLLRYRNRDVAREREEARANQAFLHTYGGTAVRILQFYARDGELVEGRSTVLCYGVVNATSVRIDPPVEGVSPALNRCVEVAPLQDTRYTLTAGDEGGRSASESFTLHVVADAETLPKITSFRVARQGADGGRRYYVLAFQTQNGVTVEVDPPVIPTMHGAPIGQFTVVPNGPTVYTLKVTGKHGRVAKRSLTLQP